MGVLERISRIIRSNINDLLDKVEDPEKILQQLIEDMQQDLREAKLQAASAIRDHRKMEKQYQDNLKMAEVWEKRAISAVKEGNDNLAREALTRKKSLDQLAKDYKDQLDEQAKTIQSLKTSLSTLEAKIEEAKRKKDLLIARQKRAKAQRAITETMSGMAKSSAFATLERMENRVKEAEIQAEAITEVESNKLENKFTELESIDIDNELERLKAQIKEKEE